MVCELSSSEHSVRSINDHRALFAASFSRDLAPTSNSLITRYGCVVRKRVVVVSCVARCPRDLLTCARFGNASFATGGKSWEAEAMSYLDEQRIREHNTNGWSDHRSYPADTVRGPGDF